ncbi:hypothetical protein GCM10028895_48680 [Pontibacter rugosus]
MKNLQVLYNSLEYYLTGLAYIAAAILVGLIVKLLLFRLLNLYNRTDNPYLVKLLTKHLSKPFSLFLPLLCVSILLPSLSYSPGTLQGLKRLTEILDIIVFAWILIKFTDVGRDLVRQKYAIEKEDNIRERRLITQLQFMRKLMVVIIIFLATALILLSFEPVQKRVPAC